MVILNLYGILFHAVLVFRPEHDFLLKSATHHTVNVPNFCLLNTPAHKKPLKFPFKNWSLLGINLPKFVYVPLK